MISVARLILSADEKAATPKQLGEGFWPWFLQRAAGAALLVLLFGHIWVNHFAGLSQVIAGRQEELVLFELVQARLKMALFIFVDFSLLGLVLFHGLNGIRNILIDLGLKGRKVNVGLIVLGVVAFVYGGIALLSFILK